MQQLIRRFAREDHGEDLIEYGLLAAFVASIALVTIVGDPFRLKSSIFATYNRAIAVLGKS
jgi:Flp pilus assembly pilin Flp